MKWFFTPEEEIEIEKESKEWRNKKFKELEKKWKNKTLSDFDIYILKLWREKYGRRP